MLRTSILGCALMATMALTVGCKGPNDTDKKRSEIVTTYKADLSKLEKQVEELKATLEKAAGEDKNKLEAKFKVASAKYEAAKKKLEELEKAAADKWEAASKDAKTALDEAINAVKEE